jgi:hypothetical protein
MNGVTAAKAIGEWQVVEYCIMQLGNEALQRQGWPCLMDYHRLIVRGQQ